MAFSWDETVARVMAKNPGDVYEIGCIDPSEALIDFVERCGQHIVEASDFDLSLTLTSGCILRFVRNESDTAIEQEVRRIRCSVGGERGTSKLEAVERVMSLREDWPVADVSDFVDVVFKAEDEREKKAFQNALHELEKSHGEEKLTFREWVDRMQSSTTNRD
jgi:hypothetical protein